MSVLSAASTRQLGVIGNTRILLFHFTSVSTGDTFVPGTKKILAAIPVMTSGPTTQASAGINASISSGTITLKPGEDSLAVDLYVLTRT